MSLAIPDLEQSLELLDVDILAHDLILQVQMPANLDGAWDVALEVESRVLVALDNPHLGIVQVLLNPVRGNQGFGVGVLLRHLRRLRSKTSCEFHPETFIPNKQILS